MSKFSITSNVDKCFSSHSNEKTVKLNRNGVNIFYTVYKIYSIVLLNCIFSSGKSILVKRQTMITWNCSNTYGGQGICTMSTIRGITVHANLYYFNQLNGNDLKELTHAKYLGTGICNSKHDQLRDYLLECWLSVFCWSLRQQQLIILIMLVELYICPNKYDICIIQPSRCCIWCLYCCAVPSSHVVAVRLPFETSN